jgi:hypothetical protein
MDYSSQAARIHQKKNEKKPDFIIIKKYIKKNLIDPDTAYNKNAIDA